MSQLTFNGSKDIDSQEAVDQRRSFLERMERKLESKESAARD